MFVRKVYKTHTHRQHKKGKKCSLYNPSPEDIFCVDTQKYLKGQIQNKIFECTQILTVNATKNVTERRKNAYQAKQTKQVTGNTLQSIRLGLFKFRFVVIILEFWTMYSSTALLFVVSVLRYSTLYRERFQTIWVEILIPILMISVMSNKF